MTPMRLSGHDIFKDRIDYILIMKIECECNLPTIYATIPASTMAPYAANCSNYYFKENWIVY